MTDFRRFPVSVWEFLRAAGLAVARNVSLALLALLLALSLWLFVTERENPRKVEAFNSSIPIKLVNVPSELAVAQATETTVRIRVEAPEDEFDDLNADDFSATVNLGGFSRGLTPVAVDVTPPGGRINVVEVIPARIDVTLEPLVSKDVDVRVSLVGSPQQGFTAGQATSEPESVTVAGAESLVDLVEAAAAEVNLTGQRADVTEDRVPLTPRDERGGDISRVTVRPETARVSVPIEQTEFSRPFVVRPSIAGQPAAGYNVTGIVVDPTLVILSGSNQVLQSIDALGGIATEEISIADARGDVVRPAQLLLPEGARVAAGTGVDVRVSIAPARGEFSFTVVPQVRNVGGGLAASAPGAVTVTLAGDVPTLQALTAAAIAVVADAQGLGAGLHLLSLQVQPPAGTTVARIDPPQIGVALAPPP